MMTARLMFTTRPTRADVRRWLEQDGMDPDTPVRTAGDIPHMRALSDQTRRLRAGIDASALCRELRDGLDRDAAWRSLGQEMARNLSHNREGQPS
jgi:hypothetical protein